MVLGSYACSFYALWMHCVSAMGMLRIYTVWAAYILMWRLSEQCRRSNDACGMRLWKSLASVT